MNDFKTYTINPEEKDKTISTIKSALLKHDEILFAYIYGSFVDPEMSCFRDIDVGIYVDEKIVPSRKMMDYSIEISFELDDHAITSRHLFEDIITA